LLITSPLGNQRLKKKKKTSVTATTTTTHTNSNSNTSNNPPKKNHRLAHHHLPLATIALKKKKTRSVQCSNYYPTGKTNKVKIFRSIDSTCLDYLVPQLAPDSFNKESHKVQEGSHKAVEEILQWPSSGQG